MQLHFYKYQGTGNDFVIIDNRNSEFPKNNATLIAFLCDRKLGIGADGLMLLENDTDTDFRMVYYNADGNQSSMCGNGGRCLVAFAQKCNIINKETTFIATDGLHYASIENDNVSLQMKEVSEIMTQGNDFFLNTGSPHHIKVVQNLSSIDVKQEGAAIRYSDLYGEEGSNINFVEAIDAHKFAIRTYERGVEDETLSCGTGATAVAIAMHAAGKTTSNQIEIQVQGGTLHITFEPNNGSYKNVMLNGPTQFVFEGTIIV